jgi:hypothetical protein
LSKYYKYDPKQAKVLTDYSGTGAMHMHRDGWKVLDAPLQAVTAQHPAPRNMVVYHGRAQPKLYRNTYISASLDPTYAKDHAQPDKMGYAHIDVIAIPKGAKGGAYVGNHQHPRVTNQEHEMILPKNPNMVLTSKKVSVRDKTVYYYWKLRK